MSTGGYGAQPVEPRFVGISSGITKNNPIRAGSGPDSEPDPRSIPESPQIHPAPDPDPDVDPDPHPDPMAFGFGCISLIAVR